MLAQRRAAGVPDSTLPAYGGAEAGKPTLPSHDDIAAELARRGVK
jgi:hypothetical protein